MTGTADREPGDRPAGHHKFFARAAIGIRSVARLTQREGVGG